MGMHAFRHCACANPQPSPLYDVYPHCTLPSIAFVVTARLQTRPSLVWRLHWRPGQPHGVLGDGQPPPCMGVHAFRLCPCANPQPSPLTLPVPYVASRCIHHDRTLADGLLVCMAAGLAARAAPRHARRWATTAMHGDPRPQALLTRKPAAFLLCVTHAACCIVLHSS